MHIIKYCIRVGIAVSVFLANLVVPETARAVASIGFCDAPTTLPRNTGALTYSPAVCIQYSGLNSTIYTLKVHLLESATGAYYCASDQWCGANSNPSANFGLDNRDGNHTNGQLVYVRTMSVFDYASFIWVMELFDTNNALVQKVELPAIATTNRAPSLNPIGARTGFACQPLTFTVSASDSESDALTYLAQDLPSGASLNSSGRFDWACPTIGVYSILIKAKQSGAITLDDAEIVLLTIQTPPPTATPTSTPTSTATPIATPTATPTVPTTATCQLQNIHLPIISKGSGVGVSPPPTSDALDRAFQHLDQVMDQYHIRFYVYEDIASAGNHFVHRAAIPNADHVSINDGYTQTVFSGTTAIGNVFTATTPLAWGGWIFQVGMLEGNEKIPKSNWGTYANAGHDLRDAKQLVFKARGKNGGERVEFFAFGVGRDRQGIAEPDKAYPDSEVKVNACGKLIGCVTTLTSTWQTYTIPLSGLDLSYVLGGFGWVTNAEMNNNRNIEFYLDDIYYDLPRLSEPRLLQSFVTLKTDVDFDTVLRNVSFVYDDALVAMAYVAKGDFVRARLILDAFVYAQNHDRFFTDGRLRNAYQPEIKSPPGWKPNGKADSTRPPGWWLVFNQIWLEDAKFDGTDTGNMAWAMLALLTYYEAQGGQQYLDAAIKLGEWIETNTRDTRGNGGYTGGYIGYEPSPPKQLWKSTEHNIDLYVAFTRLYRLTNDAKWQVRAQHAYVFAQSMWNETGGHFYTGTEVNGITINKTVNPLDGQTWSLMAFGKNPKTERAVINIEKTHCLIETLPDGRSYLGFDFNENRDGIWLEGTGQVVVAEKLLNRHGIAQVVLNSMRKVQDTAPRTNGLGIVATVNDTVDTGFDWEYYNRLHIGATAWFIFAEMGYNPYWHTSQSPIPPQSRQFGE